MKSKVKEQAEKVVEHYGTKGMQWGVRKKRSRSSDSSTVKSLRKKKAFELSDDEIKKVNSRINLEKQYSQLNPSVITTATKAVGGVLGNIAKNVITDVGTKYAKKIVGGG